VIDLLAAQGLAGDYPHTWDDFIAQDPVKRQLRVACQSARTRNEPLSHTLLASGMPGIGKTSLALLITAELGADLRVGFRGVSANQARIVLAGMRDRDVLFGDEIHRLVEGGKRHAEWLLHPL
jgi:holliday junction DNA helicase RuvB